MYSINKDFNRQNMVINSIKRFDENGLSCIMPVFKDNSISEITCKNGDGLVSYSYLKQQGNGSVNSFVSNLKTEGYNSFSWENGNDFEQYKNMQVAINFPEEFGATIWGYNKLYLIKKGEYKESNLFSEKRLDNSLAALAGNYYVTLNTDDGDKSTTFERIYLINVKDGLKDPLFIEEENGGISRNIYFAGVVGKKVYIVDKTNKKEYEINTADKSIKVVGSETLSTGLYYNGEKMVNVDINELINNNYYFKTNVEVADLSSKYGNIEIKESNKKYYFKNDAGEVFYVLKSDLDHPVKLFSLSNLREWKVIGDSVFGISGDTLYMYNFDYGLKPIIKNGDLASYSNFYDIFKK